MWNSSTLMRWKSLWQQAGFKHLVIAVLLSLILHLFLLGKFDFNLADSNEAPHLIEAQLVLKKTAPPKVERVAPTAKPPERESPKQTQEAFETKPEMPAPSSPSDTNLISDKPTPIITDEVEPTVEPPAEDTGLTINPDAYKYVETEFDVRTGIAEKIDSNPAGRAKTVYQVLPSGNEYQIKNVMQAKGLVALFVPDLLQTSDGLLNNTGLQPQFYLYQLGDNKNKTYRAEFDWESKKLRLLSAKSDKKLDLIEGTQDLLSFMYQFMYVPPLHTMQLSITNGRKLGLYDYSFEGEETVATKIGNLNTIHVARRSDDGDEKTELWLALDYQYVPVKIRKTEKEGRVYELLVTNLKTEPPATPQ
jgi:hypothetical protein